MERKDIQELQAQRAYPSVSLFVPVYAASAEDRHQTPVRIRNLIRQTEERLIQEFARGDIAPLLDRLQTLAGEVDPQHKAGGIALFANAGFGRSFYLPFSVEERIVINHVFALRELVVASARTPRYRVVSLTEKRTHVFEGADGHLKEIKDGVFPLAHEVEGVQTELPSTFGVDPSRVSERAEREYFQRVIRALEEVHDAEPLPLVLAGVERTTRYFYELAGGSHKGKFDIVGCVHGNFEKLPKSALEDKVAPLLQKLEDEAREKAKFRLTEAVGPGRATFGLKEVWKQAIAGRIDTLLVEEDYHQSARLRDNGVPRGDLEYVSEGTASGPGGLDDAVDETVETVLHSSGDVVFFPSGSLGQKARIAAILRY